MATADVFSRLKLLVVKLPSICLPLGGRLGPAEWHFPIAHLSRLHLWTVWPLERRLNRPNEMKRSMQTGADDNLLGE